LGLIQPPDRPCSLNSLEQAINDKITVSLTDNQFVPIPNFYKLDKQPIQYLDILIYTALKSFDNDDKDCFPKHETIAKRAGMSKRFVINSIKRLEAGEFLTVLRSDKKRTSNHYSFKKYDHFEMIPFDLLSQQDLTPNEKAILIGLRQFFIHGPLQCMDDISFFAKWLGLTYNTISPLYMSLVEKGYIKETQKIYKGKGSGKVLKTLTDKVSWDQMTNVKSILNQTSSTIYPILKVA
jgi:DNA-binding MarR family transcriptional regulator